MHPAVFYWTDCKFTRPEPNTDFLAWSVLGKMHQQEGTQTTLEGPGKGFPTDSSLAQKAQCTREAQVGTKIHIFRWKGPDNAGRQRPLLRSLENPSL